VSLGNFLIKRVALELQQQLPRLKRFCTLSPIPGLAAWLQRGPDFDAIPGLKRGRAAALAADAARLAGGAGGWSALQTPAGLAAMSEAEQAALLRLAATWLALVSPLPGGDPVARFHLDNGARLERLNPRANPSPAGLRPSFGLMVNYLYDLDRIEAHHSLFRQGSVASSRAVQSLL
jgi:malonyl-CoA decarboxylase